MIKGLIDYQEKALNDACRIGEKTLIWNWTRNAGKTYMLAIVAIESHVKNIVYIPAIHGNFTQIFHKINSRYGYYSFKNIKYTQSFVEIEKFNGEITKIYNLENALLPENKDIIYDFIFFDDSLPYDVSLRCNKLISTITTNNYDRKLERLYFTDDVYIHNVDFKPVMDIKLLNKEHLRDEFNSGVDTTIFCNEYAILSNPLDCQNKTFDEFLEKY